MRDPLVKLAEDVLRVLKRQQEYFAARRRGEPGSHILDECRSRERDLKRKCEDIVTESQAGPKLF